MLQRSYSLFFLPGGHDMIHICTAYDNSKLVTMNQSELYRQGGTTWTRVVIADYEIEHSMPHQVSRKLYGLIEPAAVRLLEPQPTAAAGGGGDSRRRL